MNRSIIGFFLLPLALFLLVLISVHSAEATPVLQNDDPAADAPAAESLSPALQMRILQTIPVTLTIPMVDTSSEVSTTAGAADEAITATAPSSVTVQSFALVLDLAMDFAVSRTMTSTVPSTITLALSDDLSATVPMTLVVGMVDMTTVVVAPIAPAAELSATAELTDTQEITDSDALTGSIEVTPTADITSSADITSGIDITTTESVTPTIAATPELTATESLTDSTQAPITATANITANLRAGASIDFDIVDTISPGAEVEVLGTSADGLWYFLSSANWIFGNLVDNAPDDVAVATDALIAETTQAAADRAAAEAEEATEEATEETPGGDATGDEAAPADDASSPATDEPAPDEEADEPAATDEPLLEATPEADAETDQTPEEATTDEAVAEPAPLPPTVRVDANLRAGPGTDFELVGGTITGAELDIVGRNTDGSWYLLSNGGWVSGTLVVNPPANEDVDVVADDASPFLTPDEAAETDAPATDPASDAEDAAPQEDAPILVPTPTPEAEASAGSGRDSPTSTGLGTSETLYLEGTQAIITRYETTAGAAIELLTALGSSASLLDDDAWRTDIDAAIDALLLTGQQVRTIEPPPLFAAAQNDLNAAANAFDEAALTMQTGIVDTDVDALRAAQAALDRGIIATRQSADKLSLAAN